MRRYSHTLFALAVMIGVSGAIALPVAAREICFPDQPDITQLAPRSSTAQHTPRRSRPARWKATRFARA